MVKDWNKLPEELVDFPSLEVLKTCWDGLLSPDLVEGVSADGRGVELDDL